MHLDTALALMEEMRSRNVQPNTHTYSSLLNVCVKAGQLNMALGVYNEVSCHCQEAAWVWACNAVWECCVIRLGVVLLLSGRFETFPVAVNQLGQ